MHAARKLLVTCIAFAMCLVSFAQQVERDKLMVAYMYSLAKNIEWSQPKEVYRIQVVSTSQQLIQEFEMLSQTRKLHGGSIEVIPTTALGLLENIDIVYFSREFSSSVRTAFDRTRGNEVLIISEAYTDQRFIMINFITSSEPTLSFEINRANIINQNLSILPEMILLGGTEVDVAQLYREAQDSVRAMESEISKLQGRYDSLELSISESQQLIFDQDLIIDDQTSEIYAKQDVIIVQSRSLDSLLVEVGDSEGRLDSLSSALKGREQTLQSLQQDIDTRSAQLLEGNETLERQSGLISEQDKKIKQREARLEEMVSVIDSQQNALIFSVLFSAVVVIFSILIFRAYGARKRDAKKLSEQKEELSKLLDELKQAQSQLIQSEKMASLGVLTAGIAHEINNAINFVYSGIQILEMKFSEIEPVIDQMKNLNSEDAALKSKVSKLVAKKEKVGYQEAQELIADMIKSIQIGAERTAEIVRGLRTFSRSETDTKTLVDVHKDLEVTLLLLKSRHKDSIQIDTSFDNKIPEIDGFQGQLGQAFLNIISNSLDAVEQKGPDARISIETLLQKKKVEIKIKDNGVGIKEDQIDKIFDPFFTTKKVGVGTGLGLSITYGIIERHGGTISVTSTEGEGTEFLIAIPL